MNSSDIKNKTLEVGGQTFADMMAQPTSLPVYDRENNFDSNKSKNIDIHFDTSKAESSIDAVQAENMMN